MLKSLIFFIKNERIFPVFLKCRLLVTIISSSTNLSHKSNTLKTKDRKCFPLITLYLFIILNYKGNHLPACGKQSQLQWRSLRRVTAQSPSDILSIEYECTVRCGLCILQESVSCDHWGGLSQGFSLGTKVLSSRNSWITGKGTHGEKKL